MREVSKSVLIILLALILVLLDTSFFAVFAISGVSVISSFAILIIFSLLTERNDFVVLALSLVLFLTIFSSLPLWLTIFFFVVLPGMVLYLRKGYLPEPSILISSIYFLLGYGLLGIFLIIIGNSLTSEVVTAFLSFWAINTIAGVVLYALTSRLRNYLQPGKQIKI